MWLLIPQKVAHAQLGKEPAKMRVEMCVERFSGLCQTLLALMKVCSVKEQQKAWKVLEKAVIGFNLLFRKIISAAT